jgi:hypothetical protein
MDGTTFAGILEWGGPLVICLNLALWATITILKVGNR